MGPFSNPTPEKKSPDKEKKESVEETSSSEQQQQGDEYEFGGDEEESEAVEGTSRGGDPVKPVKRLKGRPLKCVRVRVEKLQGRKQGTRLRESHPGDRNNCEDKEKSESSSLLKEEILTEEKETKTVNDSDSGALSDTIEERKAEEEKKSQEDQVEVLGNQRAQEDNRDTNPE